MNKEVKAKDEQPASRTAEPRQGHATQVLKDGLKDLLQDGAGSETELSPMVPVIPTSNVKPKFYGTDAAYGADAREVIITTVTRQG